MRAQGNTLRQKKLEEFPELVLVVSMLEQVRERIVAARTKSSRNSLLKQWDLTCEQCNEPLSGHSFAHLSACMSVLRYHGLTEGQLHDYWSRWEKLSELLTLVKEGKLYFGG